MVEFLVLTFGADKGLGYYGLWELWGFVAMV